MNAVPEYEVDEGYQPFTIISFSLANDLRPIVKAWEEAFRAPPNGPRFGHDLYQQLMRHARYPHFSGLAAYDNSSGDVLGMAYGHSNEPGQWWYDRVAYALGPQRTAQILKNSYSVTELGVIPQARRCGVGQALITALLQSQPHPRALLSTRADNVDGLAFYRSTGWQIVLPEISFGWSFPPYTILVVSSNEIGQRT